VSSLTTVIFFLHNNLAVLFAVLYNVQITGHQDYAVGGSQVWCVNAELVSPSSNLGQRYTVLFCVVLLYYFTLFSFRCLCTIKLSYFTFDYNYYVLSSLQPSFLTNDQTFGTATTAMHMTAKRRNVPSLIVFSATGNSCAVNFR